MEDAEKTVGFVNALNLDLTKAQVALRTERRTRRAMKRAKGASLRAARARHAAAREAVEEIDWDDIKSKMDEALMMTNAALIALHQFPDPPERHIQCLHDGLDRVESMCKGMNLKIEDEDDEWVMVACGDE